METDQDFQNAANLGETVWIDAFDTDQAEISESPVASLKIVSYNILAEPYTREDWFPKTPYRYLLYSDRAPRILKKLVSTDADIICLQELDHFQDYWSPELKKHGYDSFYLCRPHKHDGCGIFYKESRFVREKSTSKQYDDGSLRIGIAAQLSFKSPVSSKPRENSFVIGTTHLYWDHVHQDYQAAELKSFLKHIQMIFGTESPIIITGDMNNGPGSLIHTAMRTGFDGRFPFQFRHAYRNYLGTGNEPQFSCFKSPDNNYWIDYVWYWTPSAQTMPWTTEKVLALPTVEAANKDGCGLPNTVFPSDHLAVGAQLNIFDLRK